MRSRAWPSTPSSRRRLSGERRGESIKRPPPDGARRTRPRSDLTAGSSRVVTDTATARRCWPDQQIRESAGRFALRRSGSRAWARVARRPCRLKTCHIAARLLTWPARSPGSRAPSRRWPMARCAPMWPGARDVPTGTSGAGRVSRPVRQTFRDLPGRSLAEQGVFQGRPGTPRPAPLAARHAPRSEVRVRPDGSLVAFDGSRCPRRSPPRRIRPRCAPTASADPTRPERAAGALDPVGAALARAPRRQVRRHSKPDQQLTDQRAVEMRAPLSMDTRGVVDPV